VISPVPLEPPPLPVETIAMVARWKPVHLGHAAVLRGLVRNAQTALIGIGSSNKYDIENPFTAAETADMIRLVLTGHDNFKLIEVPDLGNGPRWRSLVRQLFGPVDVFVTSNAYVYSLLREVYPMMHPVRLVPASERNPQNGAAVRQAMARPSDDWAELLPQCVADYLRERGLIERFRREFGRATLASFGEC
jgi:nicotinamide-nucleotide adenylyltransferase